MRTVLTGGTGVIGRAATTALVADGHDVAVVTRSAANDALVRSLGARPVRGGVFDRDSLVVAFEGADAVISLATHVPVGSSARVPMAWRTNDRLRTEGVRTVVEAARLAGVRRVVQESVSVLYADQGDEWVTEQSPLDINGSTEPAAVAECAVQDYTAGPRSGVVLRLGSIVGDDGQSRHLVRATLQGRAVGLGHPSDWAHVVHTDDLGPVVAAALHAPSGVYNVGAEPVRRLDLAQGYAEAAGVDAARFTRASSRRLGGSRLEPLERSLRVCSDHFASQTGWRPVRPKFDASWLDCAAVSAHRSLHDVGR